ncbi:putative adenylyltransferase/sulfurtransferase MoeZ [compost metagenome]
MNRILAGATLGVMLLSGCGAAPVSAQQGVSTRVKAKAEVGNVSVAEAKALIATNPKLVLIDVREANEFEAGHIQGALLRPLGQVSNWSKGLDKDAEYLLVCRSGHRSGLAASRLVSFGFTHVTSVTGGMIAWSEAGYPSVVGNR